MSNAEILNAVKELREYIRIQEEAEAAADALRDQIKAHMVATGSEELAGSDYKITWRPVTSSRLDTTAIKKAFPADALAPYIKTTTARRFILQ